MSDEIMTVFLFETDEGVSVDETPDEGAVAFELPIYAWEEYQHAAEIYHRYQHIFQRHLYAGDTDV